MQMFTTEKEDKLEMEVSQSDSINQNIIKLAAQAAEYITKNKDAEFASITQDMTFAAQHCYPAFQDELKSVLYDTCYDLFENKIPREKIANVFYNNTIKCCKSFLV